MCEVLRLLLSLSLQARRDAQEKQRMKRKRHWPRAGHTWSRDVAQIYSFPLSTLCRLVCAFSSSHLPGLFSSYIPSLLHESTIYLAYSECHRRKCDPHPQLCLPTLRREPLRRLARHDSTELSKKHRDRESDTAFLLPCLQPHTRRIEQSPPTPLSTATRLQIELSLTPTRRKHRNAAFFSARCRFTILTSVPGMLQEQRLRFLPFRGVEGAVTRRAASLA